MFMPQKDKHKFPFHGWIGLVLVIVFWILNWSLTGLRTQWGFFGLWLGYALTVDGLVYLRKGSSLLARSIKRYIGLFLISAPAWWLFELLDHVTKNWIYDGRQYFTDLQYFLLASLSFSTVMPAVFGTAELFSTFKWTNKIKNGIVISESKSIAVKLLIIGLISLLLVLIWPNYFFYLVWISVYLIVEPLNVFLKNRTLLSYTKVGNWSPIITLAVGTLTCGFFWEMWNYLSYPKWIYHLPIANIFHVFEMPLPGYLGYIPFSLELFAIYHLVTGILLKDKGDDYIQID